MTDAEKLTLLRDLLLDEDRNFANKILEKVDTLTDTVNIDEKLSQKVEPIISRKLTSFVEEIPVKLGPTITEALSEQIKNSQDEVVNILFPLLGKMIKKYIQSEMKTLSDNINAQINQKLSFKYWYRKIMSFFSGVSEIDFVLADMAKSKILQLFIIEKGSGLIIARYSNTDTIDEDLLAGMLTAIKSFVEDAFIKGDQNLELIEYELYKIYLQNFPTYYISAVISGKFDAVFKNRVENDLFDFANKHIKKNIGNKQYIEQKLKEYFINA
ncbi:MAG: cell envelope biogenesis protein OmpA [Sphingobacteriales bacterium]|jgi:hypothetical protein|nr:MAG: cell envelope biogenesis protein OmpA [Sphingobacteriales bacterium]